MPTKKKKTKMTTTTGGLQRMTVNLDPETADWVREIAKREHRTNSKQLSHIVEERRKGIPPAVKTETNHS